MASSATGVRERLANAKAQAQELKNQIKAKRATMEKGSLSDAASDSKQAAVGPEPKCRRVLQGHFGKVYAMHWAGDSEQLVSASQDGKLIVWNGKTTNKIQAIPLKQPWMMTCAYEQTEDKMVATGGLDNICNIFHLGQPMAMKATMELHGHEGYLSCCRFVDRGHMLTSAGDSACMYWDVETGEQLQAFTDHGADVMFVSISPKDKNLFVSGSCDSQAMLWDLRVAHNVATFDGHDSDINAVSFMSNGTCFSTGSEDSSCKLYDIRACGPLSTFENTNLLWGITSVAFSKSGRLLFAGYDDFNCHVWDVLGKKNDDGEAKALHKISKHNNRVSCVGVTNTGEALCTGSWDTTLIIWA